VAYRIAPTRVTFSDLRAGGVIHGEVNNIGGSRRWLITVMVQLTSTRLVVRKSVDNTHGIACSLCDSCA